MLGSVLRQCGLSLRTPIASELLGSIRSETIPLISILVLSLATTALALAQPLLTRYLIDDGLVVGDMRTVTWLCIFMVLLGLASSLSGMANRWLYVSASGRILFALRERVYKHLQTLSPAQLAQTRGGDLMARLDGDVAEIQRFGIDAPLTIINSIFALVGAIVVMWTLSPQLTAIAFVLLPAEFLFLRFLRPRIETETRRVRGRADDIAGFFMDGLPAMKFIQSVRAEAREADRLQTLNKSYLTDLLRLQLTSYAASGVPNLLILVSTATVFVVGGAQVVEKTLTLGTLIAFTAYLARATGPVQSLLGLYVGFMRMRVSLARVLELTTIRPEVAPPVTPRSLATDAKGGLVFERVSFRYSPDRPRVLQNVTLRIMGGIKLGLIGASGAGKSTVTDLLHRHYDPEVGRILLDGVDLRELDLGELRRHIAVVAQDTFIMAGTIEDNIRYAAPSASDAAVSAAIQMAQLDRFIAELPDGINTKVGWRGATLSGGQRQRVSIARALLQDPLILIMDEATSAVDLEGEAQISRAIDELFANRTRIVISHRPAALADCDQVVRLSNGQIETAQDVRAIVAIK